MADEDEYPITVGREFLGSAIRARREEAHFTRRQLSALTGVGYDSLFSIEKGRRLPNLSTLYKLSGALNTTPRELLKGVYPWDGGEPPSPEST